MSLPFLTDGVYTTLIPPSPAVAQGAPNLPSFIVGTASWGPLNTPLPFSETSDLYVSFGPIQQTQFDLSTCGTQYVLACQSAGKSGNCFGIRVSDGTDLAAQITIQDTQTTPGNVAVFTATSTGTLGNTGTATLSQNAQWTSSKPIYDLALTLSGTTPENFQGIVAWKTTSGTPAYDQPTFIANLISAVNSGQNINRAKSANWIASTPGSASTHVPSLTTFSANGTGTNGSSGVTSGMLIGTDGLVRTGMYAGRKLGTGQFSIAGLTDFTVAGAMAAFAQSEDSLAVGPSFPTGTPTAQEISTKQSNNANSVYSMILSDWYYWFDPTLQKLRLVSPEGAYLGIVSSTPPWASPGNQPQYGLSFINATDRAVPRSQTESNQATQSGISWIGPMARNESLLGISNGQNASGLAGQDGVNYTRLSNYIIQEAPSAVGYLVDALQGTSANDGTRQNARASMRQFLSGLTLDSFNVVCDLTNNSTATIAAGQLIINISCKYLGVARFIQLNVQGGVTVTVVTNNVSILQAA